MSSATYDFMIKFFASFEWKVYLRYLCYVPLIWWSAFHIFRLISILWAWMVLNQHDGLSDSRKQEILLKNFPENNGQWPCVSIIKPLKGYEPYLEANIRTFFEHHYPKTRYEVLFCVSDPEDPANDIVKRLIKEYPDINARLFNSGESEVGANPKINNMMPAYKAAKYELILISDSGVRMRARTMQNVVLSMGKNSGLVHQVPYVCDRPEFGFSAAVEKIYFAGSHARAYFLFDALGVTCATGMSELIRKSALEECGGMENFGNYLAEDFFFAEAIVKKGYNTKIASELCWQNQGTCELSIFRKRLSRWQKLRAHMMPHVYPFECAMESTFQYVFVLLSIYMITGRVLSFWFFLFHFGVWITGDLTSLLVLQQLSLPRYGVLKILAAWLYREIIAPFIWLSVLINPTVEWKGAKFKLYFLTGKTERLRN